MSTLDHYQAQLDEKAARLEQIFAPFNPPRLEVFASEPEHYRMRAEFRVWHEGDDLYYIMFNQATREKYRIEQFPAASRLINTTMPLLLEALRPNPVLRRKLFQIDFLSSLSGELVISLLYHRQLNEDWQGAVQELRVFLQSHGIEAHIIGRAKKQKLVHDQDYVVEKLQVAGKELVYQQVENSFTQPNGRMNEKMLGWALNVTQDASGDLLELYCGNGNFSLAMATNFRRVLATEISSSSVKSAQYNIAANAIDNVTILRMSAEEFTQAMRGVREFRRLQGVDLQSYECNTILVDPPRAGLDKDTVQLVQEYENIVYISCNPDTLRQNLESLSQTHQISRFALFDQFPYTHHMEAGVYLTRK
ncbi:tRNA (uridine(54)-C5)-methyltransferase TrmA [Oceanimonas baumannii]|uniref:tRNA/tmRNA (uracil-C(5))-methyltransferase n=1 Tax=Oceanimonas baumannii TaxID=129578 RepID=A0A235CGD4_9GAMM|nr:tRNA (uridine(54)-C5)-methyltransferase TrmA [Oceanimonas baumannii]OYD23526.1 tRNA (uridine(54)-C5)-methyltransferase TrmA [Oceanimonas baumannii]TDW56937.1 tRNA (uracil-5-)-methyltransferase [Oceanimonas baumannii]